MPTTHLSIHVVCLTSKGCVDGPCRIAYVSIERSIANRTDSGQLVSTIRKVRLVFRLSISTIEEHTSNSATPVRKPMKTSDKECGIQCNVSDMFVGSTVPQRSSPRSPPATMQWNPVERYSVPFLQQIFERKLYPYLMWTSHKHLVKQIRRCKSTVLSPLKLTRRQQRTTVQNPK